MSEPTPHPSMAACGPCLGHAIGRHFETAFRQLGRGPHAVDTSTYFRLQTGEAHPFGNLAFLTDSRDLESARAAVAPLAAAAVPAAVILSDMAPTPDVDALLLAHGFARHGGPPAMGIDIGALSGTRLPAGYSWERVVEGAAAKEWTEQFARGYGLPVGLARYFSPENVTPDHSAEATTQFFAVRHNDAIVSTSVLHCAGGLAGIYCVATVPEERFKGLGAHATAEPLRLAARLGYGVGILQSSEDGYPVYTRLGFSDFGQVPLYLRMPQG
ncbi:MAG: hypothetical protein AB7N65_31120 [Vicinamibacterales bacterium]